MNAKETITLQEFKKDYCTTIKKQKGFPKSYIEIPISDYEQLGYYRHYLIKAIGYIGQAHIDNKIGDNLGYTLEYLTQLLEALNVGSELEGLTKLIDSE